MENPLAGYLNEAEKHMGSEMYAAQVERCKATMDIEQRMFEFNLDIAKQRAQLIGVLVVTGLVMVLPFWLLAIGYGVKGLF